MYGPVIPKYGLTETIAAKCFARFDAWPDFYTKAIRNRRPPPHVVALSEKYRRERYWEKPDEPKKVSKPAAKSDGAWWGEVLAKAAAMAPKTVAPVKEEESDDWWLAIEKQAAAIKAGQ